MDSLTQITLGAAVGAALLGKSHGRKALALGAVVGTLPDLDVFIPMPDPVSSFTYHRGFSHAILFHLFLTPVLVWLFSKIKWFDLDFRNIRHHITVFLILLTHALLDALTIYGTQLFWPLSSPPVAIGSIYIIDPLYTVPLLVSLVWFFMHRSQQAVYAGLLVSTLYLGWGVVAQTHVKNIVYDQENIVADKVLVQPTALNTILWRIVIMEGNKYRVGYYSLLDETRDIDFAEYPSENNVLKPYEKSFAVQRLQWFTKGFYSVKQDGNDVVVSDVRMGREPDGYIFQFIVNTAPNGRYTGDSARGRLDGIWERIFRDW